ncbi:DNA translocase FtsK [Tranquillimonas rosea]|uniref:DNA translocase FtsK n=1 Tax=Tranquillimonas rosea TaxID=641238 RepID=A0A1H9W713_9RHOB|nr:DNA translocase FtsK [Tranquillimonas rosea]SES29477.1 DNA translocase FtsK [Tranquillimonas rosea]
MAYQTRHRDPLFDSSTQEVIARRGKELIGLALIALGVAAAMMLASYSAEDPSFMSATDAPAQNALGTFGASIAAPLFIIVGWGSWGFPVVFLGWGLRFLLHKGDERFAARAVFAPLAIALASVYAATHVPGAEWSHSFGLGGLFGDTVLGAVLGVVPVQATLGLKVMALAVALATFALGLFVLGFSTRELRAIVFYLVGGTVMLYAGIASALGLSAKAAGRGLGSARDTAAERAERRRVARDRAKAEALERDRAMAEEAAESAEMPSLAGQSRSDRRIPTIRADRHAPEDDDVFEDDDTAPEAGERPTFLSRLFRRNAQADEAEFEDDVYDDGAEDDAGDDRIKAKIADVIRTRVRAKPISAGASDPIAAAVGRHPKGPRPMILQTGTGGAQRRVEPPVSASRAEPPVTRGAAPAHPVAEQLPGMPQDAYEDEALIEQDDVRDAEGYEMPEPELVQPEPKSLTAEPLFETGRTPDGQTRRQGTSAPSPAPEKKVVQHGNRKSQPSRKAQEEAQPGLQFDESGAEYEYPPLNLLTNPDTVERHHLSDEALEENARMLETVLDDYGVKGEIVSVRPGPVVTMYELEPAPGLKASRVIGLADDIARSMSALSARVSTVPGRSVIGIELPNEKREMTVLRELLAARDFGDTNAKLPLALGKDIGGEPVIANLAKMPHLLIAGTTGSGKSVAINTMILSLLYKLTPEECRLIMIDPKMLELSVYDGIPHLLSPVVTDPKKAVVALKWVVGEMEDRYRKMSKMGVRNIDGYNGRVREALANGETFSRTVQTGFDDETGEPIFETEEIQPETMPYIVVIVDEMADLMMVAGKEIEACIQRLAQMARASGIHLIMATQRPSVDVITGTIKANFPTRISFSVTSKIDSRTILGEQGAEQLLGMGDMLYMAGGARITRVHGPFCSDEEVEEIVRYLKAFGPPDYKSGVVDGPEDGKESDIDAVLGLGNTGGNTDGEDALYDQAVAIVIKDRKCSTSYIQRKLAIGYNKAARLVEQMEDEGVVSSANHVGKREILVPEQQ